MPQPRVEAGDRALETARKIRQYFLDYYEKLVGDRNFNDGLVVLLDDFVTPIVEEYKSLGFRAGVEAHQSAMNAQERELREALLRYGKHEWNCQNVCKCGWNALRERLLAERGEKI